MTYVDEAKEAFDGLGFSRDDESELFEMVVNTAKSADHWYEHHQRVQNLMVRAVAQNVHVGMTNGGLRIKRCLVCGERDDHHVMGHRDEDCWVGAFLRRSQNVDAVLKRFKQ